MTPRTSVVIVTYNSANDVGPCLASITVHTGDPVEVIVIDNASSDRTVALVRNECPSARVVERRTNGGLARAINDGVALATGDVIAVLNPDTRFEHDVVSPLAAALRRDETIGIIAPKLLDPDGAVQLSCRAFPGHAAALFNRYSLLTRLFPRNRLSRRYLMSDFRHDERRDVDWVSGAALMFRRDVFDRVGGWDPGFFMFSEDVDFCKRVHDAGYRVVYEPSVSLVHDIGGSRRSAPALMVVERHRSMWRYYHKHLRGNILVDAATAGGILVRCGALLALDAVRRVSGRSRV